MFSTLSLDIRVLENDLRSFSSRTNSEKGGYSTTFRSLQLQISALCHMQTYLHKICVKLVWFVELKKLCVASRITSPFKYKYFAALSAL